MTGADPLARATPFQSTTRDFPYVGYDCACKTPSVYREVRNKFGVATIFSLCPVCDDLPADVSVQQRDDGDKKTR